MKKQSVRIMLLVLTLVCAMASVTSAAALPRVALIYTNNANTTYDTELDSCVLDNLNKTLSQHFEVVKNDTVVQI